MARLDATITVTQRGLNASAPEARQLHNLVYQMIEGLAVEARQAFSQCETAYGDRDHVHLLCERVRAAFEEVRVCQSEYLASGKTLAEMHQFIERSLKAIRTAQEELNRMRHVVDG